MLIVYKDSTNSVFILIPSSDCLFVHELQAIALKDVPEGLPYWFVEESDIPADRTFRDAWEIPEEWGEPDGYGSEFNTFEELEEEKDVEDQPTESD